MRRLAYAFIAIMVLAFAAGFPAYLAFGQGGGGHVTIAVTATPLVEPGGGGGGGGGGGEEGGGCPAGTVSAFDRITYLGMVTKTIVVMSPDRRFRLTIDEGTTALDREGKPISCIGIFKTDTLPAPPAGAYIISVWYDVSPEGATFSPAATLEYTGEPEAMPAGVDGQKLAIAYYDEASGRWVLLASVVDTEASKITTRISQFSDLAVFGFEKEIPPPAAFEIGSLGVSPTAVYSGEAVNITVLVTNTGGQAGSYQVILKINGVEETAKEVILEGGASTEVSFTALKIAAGSYSVDVNGLNGTFEVRLRPVVPPTKPFDWWLIVGIVSATALAALVFQTYRSQRRLGGVTGVLGLGIGKAFSLTPKLTSKAIAGVRSLFSKIGKAKVKKGKG